MSNPTHEMPVIRRLRLQNKRCVRGMPTPVAVVVVSPSGRTSCARGWVKGGLRSVSCAAPRGKQMALVVSKRQPDFAYFTMSVRANEVKPAKRMKTL